jgi:uncharacterized protein
MILNTKLIPEGTSVVTHTIGNSDDYPDLPRIPDGITCRCQIDRQGNDITVDVEYAGSINLECARCLESFNQAVNGRMYVILEFAQDQQGTDDDHSVFYYNDQTVDVDIRPALFDEIMTSLPLMPLCRENCPGVSPGQSGVSRKKPDEQAIDPRWEALKKLKR